MPRPRDQRLYFELQGKLTQQEVDYNNMHQHHTIVRAPQGKETKFGKDQYHTDMKTGDFQDVAGHRAPSVKDFKPVNEQQPSRKASEPKKNGDAPLPSKSATQIRTNNLPPLPTEPPRVVSTNEAEAAKEALKRNAPNMNTDIHLTQLYTSVADRVKERRRKTQFKGLAVTPKKTSGIGKAKRGGSMTKVKKADSSGMGKAKTSKNEIKQVRLNTKEDKEAGRRSKRMGMTRSYDMMD